MTARLDLREWPWAIALGLLAAGLGVLAVAQPLLALGLALGLVFMALVLTDVTLGLCLFGCVAFMELPGPGGFSIAKLVGLALVVSWAATAVTRGDRHNFFKTHPTMSYVLVLFLAFAGASTLWAKVPIETGSAIIRFLPNMLLLPIAVTAIKDRRSALMVCGSFVFGAVLSASLGQFVDVGGAPEAITDAEAGLTSETRLIGVGVNPNELAIALVGATAIGLGLAASRALSSGWRLVGAAGTALCLVFILLTASRTGLLGILVAIVLGSLFAGRSRRAPLLVVGLLAALSMTAYVVALAPPEVRQRITASDGGSGRDDIWRVGWRMVQDNPVQGVGLGNFRLTSIDYLLEPGQLKRDTFILDRPKVAHNIYLETLAELGVIGLVLFLSIMGFALRCMLKAARLFEARGDPGLELVARAVFVATAAMLFSSAFVSQQYAKSLWLALALGPGLLALAHRSETSAPAARSAPEPGPQQLAV